MDLAIQSPPRPKRQALPIPPQEQKQQTNAHIRTADMVGVLQMESRLAEQAVSDLPGVFSEVFSMQRLQSDEIGRQRAFFEAMKSKIAEVESRNADLEFDVACARNKIFMKEEWIKDTAKRVKQLDEEIRKLVEEKAQQQLNITIADALSDSEIRRLRDRCEQMEEHARHVEEFEKTTSEDHKELQEVKKTIEELRAQNFGGEKQTEAGSPDDESIGEAKLRSADPSPEAGGRSPAKECATGGAEPETSRQH
ncbi:uncharacterized protein LOC128227468 isoform X2 [Mya arenaria]|uniref:uncharacterized protein LOC128227468 isoform X2 n=1 Tax=Mya arenaria TaxID=6604 RepID=UPI0022DFFC59|nr:uncharacterized protein LOC128227468 isoform X2 [Mya arenaria]